MLAISGRDWAFMTMPMSVSSLTRASMIASVLPMVMWNVMSGCARLNFLQRLDQKALDQAFDAVDDHLAASQALQFADLAPDAGKIAHRDLKLRRQELSCGRETNAIGPSLQETAPTSCSSLAIWRLMADGATWTCSAA